MKQGVVTIKDLRSVNDRLYKLQCLPRWSGVTVGTGRFTESAKQALNCMVAYVWGKEIQHLGYEVDFCKFPKIAIVRSFTKALQCDVSEHDLDSIFEIGGVSKKSFNEMVWGVIKNDTSPAFFNHLQIDDGLESRIYRAATKLSSLIELRELEHLINSVDYSMKEEQITKVINEFSDLPCFDIITSESYMEIFRNFSKLRNRIRWALHPNIVPSSVLGHMFDVACYAYMMSLEVYPTDENLSARFFFMGVFHDLPETWTGDMPSPVKDSLPGLRKATEEFENKVMKQHVYNHLPPHMVNAIRYIMLEDENNTKHKVFLKKADNFSAYVECCREVDAGSHHQYYRNVINADYKRKESLPLNFRLLLEELYDACH